VPLKLYKTRYPNIKRTTKRAQPDSTYYVVFDQAQPEVKPKKPATKDKLGKAKAPEKKKRKRKKKYRIPIGQANPTDPKSMDKIRERGLELMAQVKEKKGPEFKTLGEVLRLDLVARSQRLKPSTKKRYELSDRNIKEALGEDLPLKDLTSEMVKEWILRRQQQVTNGTINRDIARLKMVTKWARKKKRWLTIDPMEEVDRLREADERTRFLSDSEEERLWSVSSPWLWRVIFFAAMTGLRQGEQFSLRWDQISDGLIKLRGDETKGGRPRYVPITPAVQEILDSCRGEDKELVFVTEATRVKIHPSNFARDYWRPALKAAGIKDFRWHDLRHTFCSWIVQSGGRLEKVQELAGHVHYQTTKKYAHLAPEHLVETVNLLEERRKRRPSGVVPIGKAKAK